MAHQAGKQDYREDLIKQLRERNRREVAPFKELILQNNRLIDNATQLKADNLKLSVENEQLRLALTTTGGNCGRDATATQLAMASVEKKLLAQQEELTELHKRKGENSQLIVDLNVKMEKQQQLIKEKENCLIDYKTANNSLKAEVQMLNNSLEELKKLNTTLLDEHTALQLAFSALEEKLRSVQDENHSLLERLMRYKTKDADKLNEENESFIRKRTDKVKRELEDAAREPNNLLRYSRNPSSTYLGEDINIGGSGTGTGSGSGSGCGVGVIDIGDDFGDTDRRSIGTNITEPCLELTDDLMMQHLQSLGNNMPSKGGSPTTVFMKFDCHENESHALRWSPVERVIATGGADRKVKLWDLWKGSTEPRAILSGSSAGINSVDFDSIGAHIIGTSNDYGARVWTVADNRLRHTLTGHSGKVMAAKYIQEPVKVVTGSYDRTLKIWDLHNGACIATKFAGSSCNDLVTTDSLGSMIISGHYDKRVRFWDIRTEKFSDDILMNSKITSLDLSKDGHLLICSIRDDTIQMLDLRKNQIINSYCNDNFKLSCDWARASINHNAMKIACGSTDGLIYIWDIDGNLDITLKGHSSPVHAVSWSPNCNTLASVGKSKRCIIYTET